MAAICTTKPNFPPVRACLFDMDGLLINTEDILSLCHNTLLARYHSGPIPWHIKCKLQGRPAREAIAILLTWANLTSTISVEEYYEQLYAIQEVEFQKAVPLPGVENLLKTLKMAKGVHLALATSSDRGRFELKTRHLEGLFEVFEEKRRVLTDDPRLAKGRGKPNPDIYLLALKTINDDLAEGDEPIKAEECLVFEDSVPGVIAGRRAGMRVVWVPHPGLALEYKGREAEVLAGRGEGSEANNLGMAGDGWGEQLLSLESFPYSSYNIRVDETR